MQLAGTRLCSLNHGRSALHAHRTPAPEHLVTEVLMENLGWVGVGEVAASSQLQLTPAQARPPLL